ncbi:hypothetical protein JCM16303_000949 [Sporobolomyces ruberrimus]
MWTPPPPSYRSNTSTPQRLSTSTAITTTTSDGPTGSISSSRDSSQSFDFSPRSSLGTCPSILTSASSIGFKDRGVAGGTAERQTEIEEEDEGEISDDSPVDPRQVQTSSCTDSSGPRPNATIREPPRPYLYFSPLVPLTPRPSAPPRQPSDRSVSSSSFYPYPLDYGETSWTVLKEVRNGGGTDTPRSERTFRTTATDGSDHEVENSAGRKTSPLPEGEGQRQARPRIVTPLKSCLKPPRPSPTIPLPSPINPTSPLSLSTGHEPFRPTSPLVISPSLFPQQPKKDNPPPRPPRPTPLPTTNSFASSSSSLTVTPESLILTPTLSRRISHSPSFSTCSTAPSPPPQKIWSARTNRYIYIHSVPSPPIVSRTLRASQSTTSMAERNRTEELTLSSTRGKQEKENSEMVQIPDLPYVTRAPLESGRTIVDSELVIIEERGRGRSRSRSRGRWERTEKGGMLRKQ